ncbi:MAG TPA: hypothetical protein VL625_01525 [Patescibacteria group bacterium]|jgi:hypothetical protein|nr:hypothetical protein [Patescibacteria group bacterium]
MSELGKSFRKSTGPLYSQSQLALVEKYLASVGLTAKQDNKLLGTRIYSNGEPGGEGQAVIYLDELGCHPNLSGTMILGLPGKEATATNVWTLAQERDIAETKNPLLRGLKHLIHAFS